MKFLRTFENFYLPTDMETDEQDYLSHSRKMKNVVKTDDDDDYCEPCASDDTKDVTSHFNTDYGYEEGDTEMRNDTRGHEEEKDEEDADMRIPHIMRFEGKKTKPESYEKSGLKHPEKADRNKNKKIEGWEKAIAKKIEASMDKKKK